MIRTALLIFLLSAPLILQAQSLLPPVQLPLREMNFSSSKPAFQPEEPETVVVPPQRKKALQAAGLSLLIPGAGQAKNGEFVKTGVMIAVEAAAIAWNVNRTNRAKSVEREYHAFGDANFSVVKYAAWLVDYNQFFETSGVTLQDLARPGQTIDPNNLAANARDDWAKVDLEALRELESVTLFAGNSGNAFSHFMPDYGSQQYYELMSKYYQFGPGWKDYSRAPGPSEWNPAEMSEGWFYHGKLGRTFNDAYRTADLALNLILLNHAVAAIDAYIVGSKRVHLTTGTAANLQSIYYGLRFDF